MPQKTVTKASVIREMDADELKNLIESELKAAGALICAVAELLRQTLELCNKQHRQLTGHDLLNYALISESIQKLPS